MFKRTKNHTLLTILCASIIITSTTSITAADPIKAWSTKYNILTSLGITAGFIGLYLYKKTFDYEKQLRSYITNLKQDKELLQELPLHNQKIQNINDNRRPENPYIWENWSTQHTNNQYCCLLPYLWELWQLKHSVKIISYKLEKIYNAHEAVYNKNDFYNCETIVVKIGFMYYTIIRDSHSTHDNNFIELFRIHTPFSTYIFLPRAWTKS